MHNVDDDQNPAGPATAFDREIERHGTSSVKWELLSRKGELRHWEDTRPERGDDQVLPMWVADMDFAVAPAIRAAMHERVQHGIFGYTRATADYGSAICDWMHRRQGWQADPDWLLIAPGVVPAIAHVVRGFTQPGEKVLVQRPVYYPFMMMPERNGREVVSSGLRLVDGRYEMDFDDLERQASDPTVRMAILCSPHNPVGRLWTREELERYAAICADHDVLVIADEIHADLTLPGNEFVSFGHLPARLRDNAIICTAASKSFNLAGLHTSNLFIPDAAVRSGLQAEFMASGTFGQNPFGLVATEAAYRAGGDWLDAALDYISANVDHMAERLASVPGLTMMRPQATYLVWIDCRGLGLSDDALSQGLFDEAKLYFDDGSLFGPEGEGFTRINVACPRSLLDRALDRLIAFAGRHAASPAAVT